VIMTDVKSSRCKDFLGNCVKTILVLRPQAFDMGRHSESERQLQQIFDLLPHQKEVKDWVR